MASENSSLVAARKAKNDEFYTQFADIEAEMNAYYEYDNDVFRDKVILLPCDDPEWSEFTRFFASRFDKWGLKKLISTSYAKSAGSREVTEFECTSAWFDEEKHGRCGKLFVLERDLNGDGRTDMADIEFRGYLDGDGDFRSDEVTRLRDEADIIITNPPFSLFREFLAWLRGGGKKFVIIGSKNAITYKEVFPLLKGNRLWLGVTAPKEFIVPAGVEDRNNTYVRADGSIVAKFGNVGWFTNIDHGGRHEPLQLSTMADNLKYNKKLRHKLEKDYGKFEYPSYSNYDAIEVPFTECIPSDYDGVMGVPITFLDRYCPEQFEILGMAAGNTRVNGFNYLVPHTYDPNDRGGCGVIDGKRSYARILVWKTSDIFFGVQMLYRMGYTYAWHLISERYGELHTNKYGVVDFGQCSVIDFGMNIFEQMVCTYALAWDKGLLSEEKVRAYVKDDDAFANIETYVKGDMEAIASSELLSGAYAKHVTETQSFYRMSWMVE